MSLGREGLDTLCAIAHAAGREIMAVYATDFAAWQKDDASPLTEADLRADRVIRAGLEQAFPGMFILSEESASQAQAEPPSRFFLVDPLDGTKEFLKRNDEFTVNIALIEAGEAVAGVVYAPALGETFLGGRGLGAWRRAGDDGAFAEMHTSPVEPQRSLRVIGSRSHGGEALSAWLGALGRAHEFVAAGSSLKFCRIAQGQADAYPRLGPTSQWDTAAGQAVLQAAGGVVRDARGEALRYGLERPILNPDFIALCDGGLALPSLPAV